MNYTVNNTMPAPSIDDPLYNTKIKDYEGGERKIRPKVELRSKVDNRLNCDEGSEANDLSDDFNFHPHENFL